jgi:hypothetical protein
VYLIFISTEEFPQNNSGCVKDIIILAAMRFLCLHGKGTSAKIFQSQSGILFFPNIPPLSFFFPFCFKSYALSQTPHSLINIASFRKLLDPELYQFDFIDAPYPSTAAPGIDLFYPPPYYSFYDLAATETPAVRIAHIKAAHTWLLS